MVRAVGDAIITAPPLITSPEEIDLLVDRVRAALDATARDPVLPGASCEPIFRSALPVGCCYGACQMQVPAWAQGHNASAGGRAKLPVLNGEVPESG